MSSNIRVPVMPEPALFSHQTMGYQKSAEDGEFRLGPTGVHLGVPERGICEQAHIEGETCETVHEWFSPEQVAALNAQWLEMVGPVVEAAQKLMTMRVGELPHTGYLRDNDISRAALGDLNRALSAITKD